MSERRWPKAIGLVLAAGLLLAACGGSNNTGGGTKKYVVGISNTLTGNGFREEMICSIKAQAKASGVVSKVIVANRNTDPSGQIADVRNLISAGVNVIVFWNRGSVIAPGPAPSRPRATAARDAVSQSDRQ